MERRPSVALELGIQWGTVSAHLAEAGRGYNGLVIGIDIINHKRLRWLCNYSNFIFLHGSSTAIDMVEIVTHLTYQFGPVGLVYQDSSHHYLESVKEWELYSPLLDKNAIWICDDITPAFHDPQVDPPGKGMVEYFHSLPGEKRLYVNSLHYGNAQGVILL